MLLQTSHPPTRNLFGKTHWATTAVTQRSCSANRNVRAGTQALIAQNKCVLRTRDGGDDADDGDDNDGGDDDDDADDNGK